MTTATPAPAPEEHPAAEERLLTPKNIARIDDWIDESGVFAKGYWENVDGRTTVTGLRIGSDYQDRVVAKFGDTIVRHADGRFSVRRNDVRLAGLLLEQTHQYRDLDADSTCCPDGPEFGCRNYLPHGEVTA